MSPEPAKKSAAGIQKMDSPEDLARRRFGDSEGLAIVRKTTLELASFYAEEYDLPADHPEVTVLTTALAFARHKEFLLMQEMERDLAERVMGSAERTNYGAELFRVAKTGAHDGVHRELSRLHSRAGIYHRELHQLAVQRK